MMLQSRALQSVRVPPFLRQYGMCSLVFGQVVLVLGRRILGVHRLHQANLLHVGSRLARGVLLTAQAASFATLAPNEPGGADGDAAEDHGQARG